MAEVTMPRLSDTMEEGTIGRWLKKVGDPVNKGDVLAEIETDKAVMELESYDEGVLEQIVVGEGQTVPIGEVIAMVGSGEGAETQATAVASPAAPTPPAAVAAPPAAPLAPATVTTPSAPVAEAGEKVKASPMARAMARELGIDLTTLAGSGPGGRVVKLDVESAREAAAQVPAPAATGAPAAAAPASPAPPASPDGERIPLSNMRKTVARRLTESMQSAPHFYLTTVAGADALMTFRAELNEHYEKAGEDVRLSLNDLIVKACGRALGIHPEVNVSWAGDAIIRHRHVNVGIAVAVEGGLIVPVIHDTDQKSVSQISREAKGLIERARTNRLTPAEYTGSTFTVTNLGMYGIDQFTAVINPPEAAILAVGTVSPELVLRDGKVASRQVIKLTLAIDHRPLDGATAAVFLRDLKTLLEDPLRIVA